MSTTNCITYCATLPNEYPETPHVASTYTPPKAAFDLCRTRRPTTLALSRNSKPFCIRRLFCRSRTSHLFCRHLLSCTWNPFCSRRLCGRDCRHLPGPFGRDLRARFCSRHGGRSLLYPSCSGGLSRRALPGRLCAWMKNSAGIVAVVVAVGVAPALRVSSVGSVFVHCGWQYVRVCFDLHSDAIDSLSILFQS